MYLTIPGEPGDKEGNFMKKLIAIAIALLTVLSLCACGGSGEGGSKKNPEGLQVGYSRQSIMPEGQVGLGGYSDQATRKSQGFLDYVYSTCIAFSDGDETVLLYTEDLLGKSRSAADAGRAKVSEATGIPVERIIFANTHDHSAPAFNGDTYGKDAYLPIYYNAIIKAAEEALADRSPAEIYGAKVQTEGLNFVRHYIEEDGDITSKNNGNFSLKNTVGHAREADPEMVLLKLDRADESKKDIMLMNWGAHPCTVEEYNNISADYIGAVRSSFEQQTDMLFAFFQAAGGDVGQDSAIPELRHNLDRVAYGETLAKLAVEAMPTMQKIEGEGIHLTQNILVCETNIFGQDRLEEAKAVMAIPNADRETAHAHGFTSLRECAGIVNSSKREATKDMELNAIAIGGVAFTTVSWEMFSDTGKYIKEQSPYEYTMVLSCTNGKSSYIPSAEAFDTPCYEKFVAEYGKGSAEKAADTLIGMLKAFQ